jgi:cytochrome c
MKTKLIVSAAILLMAMPFVHPFGPVRGQRNQTLPAELQPVLPILEKACLDCHSERTRWLVYSYLPFLSWGLEKDVAEARAHMNFSKWDRMDSDTKLSLLGSIAAEVRNRRMPLPRYTLLHPEARLSDEDISALLDGAKTLRRNIRGIKSPPPESASMPQ